VLVQIFAALRLYWEFRAKFWHSLS